MAASFPGAVKNFSAVVNGVTKLVAALFNSPYDEITAIETALAQLIHTDGAIKAACINTTALKTTTGEVSGAGEQQSVLIPGGGYGFNMNIKSAAAANGFVSILGAAGGPDWAWPTSYRANASFNAVGSTGYIQVRYVTASGEDHWLFLKIDKQTKGIISAWSAPDHPAYGNGGDFEKVSHPFGNYDKDKYEIVLVDNDTIAELKAQVTEEKSLLTLVNELHKPNMDKEEVYKPLHSGKFLGKEPKLVQSIPDYIKVRKLIKLTSQEKQQRDTEQQQRFQLTQQERENRKQAILSKLGITEEEAKILKEF